MVIIFESYLVSQGQPKLTKVKRLFFQDGMEVKTIDDIEHDAELWMRLVFKSMPVRWSNFERLS